MSDQISVSGKILEIGNEQHITETFFKRELVIETEEKYPQKLKIEFVKEDGQKLDNFNTGDFVTVGVNLRGWESKAGNLGISLRGWRITAVAGAAPQEIPAMPDGPDATEDLPF